MKVNGILETAIYVEDLARSADFYKRLFGFETLLDSDRLHALNVAGRNVLLLFLKGGTREPVIMPGGIIPPHDGSGRLHFAFSIDASDVDSWRHKLETERIPIEGRVDWPQGAVSLYFRDPDGHLVELITPGWWNLS